MQKLNYHDTMGFGIHAILSSINIIYISLRTDGVRDRWVKTQLVLTYNDRRLVRVENTPTGGCEKLLDDKLLQIK